MKKFFLVGTSILTLSGAIALNSISVLANPPAQTGSRYWSDDFGIEVGFSLDDGWAYKGCDKQNRCIYLVGGNKWRANGEKGISWENGEYTYSLFSKNTQPNIEYLRIRKSGRQIVLRRLRDI